MLDLTAKFKDIETQFIEIETKLSDPATVRDNALFTKLSRKHRDLREIVEAFRRRERLAENLRQAKEMAAEADPDLAAMAQEELKQSQEEIEKTDREIQILLLPTDPRDERNTVMEIRAGTGGDEAGLFARDLFEMYTRYAEARKWKVEIMSDSQSDRGGFKEVILLITGDKVYSRLKYEGGTHRVQRVPATETQGRIHTSAVTVAVMPEAEEVDVVIKNEDLKIDVFRSGGPGGQSVNTTDSAVRVTHLPTGLVVSCQDEKSQHKNKAKALKVLRSRLFDAEIERQHAEIAAERKQQVGTGDRSGKIRTYNYPQNRLTDHRINLTLYSLDRLVGGDLDPVIDALIAHYQTEALQNV